MKIEFHKRCFLSSSKNVKHGTAKTRKVDGVGFGVLESASATILVLSERYLIQ